ncbi:O-antigen ligase family protein, partial [Enterococcus faecalis]|nr:O-antigen ligase family protein [Enterococcus faecalis]
GVLVLISVFFVYSFFKVFYSFRIKKQNVLVKFLCAILLSLVGCGIIYLSVDLFKWILSYIPELFNEVKTKNPVKEKPVDLTRPDVENNDDISNGRLALWKSGIELFKSSWLVGVSPRNMLPYASDMLPQTFIAKTQKYTHNSYINLLASTGSLGVVTFLSFFVSRITEIVAFSFSKVNNFFQQGYATYVLSVLAVAVSGMFLNDIILVNTIGSLIFWLFLGRIVYLSKEFK